MVENINWGLMLGFGGFGISVVVAVSGFTYLIMRLLTDPMKSDIKEIKDAQSPLIQKVKSGEELQRMMDLSISKHCSDCHRERINMERTLRIRGE